MGLLSNKVNRSQLQPGDHIYSYRRLHLYAHHGIYVGEDMVIHFTRTKVATKKGWFLGRRCKICGRNKKLAEGGVVKTCVKCFLDSHKLYRFEYGVSPVRFALKKPGTCSTGYAKSADTVIDSATYYLNNKESFGDYNLFENNCESFAVLCKTGKRMSAQAISALNTVKTMFNALVKHNVKRLEQDASVHHPNMSKNLKQTIDKLETLSVKEIIALLKRLNKNYHDGQEDVNDEELPDDDQDVETMEEGDGDGSS